MLLRGAGRHLSSQMGSTVMQTGPGMFQESPRIWGEKCKAALNGYRTTTLEKSKPFAKLRSAIYTSIKNREEPSH